jgi:hypothetical protein
LRTSAWLKRSAERNNRWTSSVNSGLVRDVSQTRTATLPWWWQRRNPKDRSCALNCRGRSPEKCNHFEAYRINIQQNLVFLPRQIV